jgi:hypothetical protein
MEAMLREWQGVVALLRRSFVQEVRSIFANTEKPPTRNQIAQFTTLTANLAALDKKVWCVPDKIETKDTTPTPADKVRGMSDDDLDRQLAAAEGAASSAASREAPKESVH